MTDLDVPVMVLRAAIWRPGLTPRAERMDFTGWQRREKKDEAGTHCEYILISARAIQFRWHTSRDQEHLGLQHGTGFRLPGPTPCSSLTEGRLYLELNRRRP